MNKKKYNIPVNEPLIIGNAIKYVSDCLKSGWVSSEGEYVSQFEKKFSNYIGKNYGVSVVNGTAAIELSIEVLDLKKGDEVIMPAFSIISCILPLVKKGISLNHEITKKKTFDLNWSLFCFFTIPPFNLCFDRKKNKENREEKIKNKS